MRIVICISLFICLNVSQATEGVFSSVSSKIPIIHIAAEGVSSFEIGLELGRQSKGLFNDIERRYDRYLYDSISQIRFDDVLVGSLPKLKKSIAPRYQKELEGVASSWSLIHANKLGDGFLSWDEYWLLNLLSDIDIGVPINGVGFSVLSRVSSESSAIIGRNLDLKNTPDLRSLQSITVYEYKNRAVVNIGFMGILSVLSGFNESGLFVSQFSVTSGSFYQDSYHRKIDDAFQVQGFLLREVLETTTSTRKAINFLSKKNISMNSNTLVGDKKNILILEQPAFGKGIVRKWSSSTRPNKQWDRKLQVAVVDCHVLVDMSNNCRRAKDSFRWDRLYSLAIFTHNEKANVQDVAKIMLDKSNKYDAIFSGEHTVQSMIYLPSNGYLYLYTAPIETIVGRLHPTYKIYYKDVIPARLRKERGQKYYIWWVGGLLLFLVFVLWWARRSVVKKDG